jgi:hypothetical protein
VSLPSARASRSLSLLVAALCGLQAPDPAVAGEAADADDPRPRFAGEYLYAGGDAERALIPAAVERSVHGMFFIARGIAYDRLLRTCEVCTRYALSFDGGSISVAGPCQITDLSPADGREVDHRTKLGDTSKLSQRFIDGTLVQYFRGEEGARRVVWTLQPDGETLRVQVIITSKHLPQPVDYTLTYRRRAALPRPAADAGASQ